jgi:hypothetical protein
MTAQVKSTAILLVAVLAGCQRGPTVLPTPREAPGMASAAPSRFGPDHIGIVSDRRNDHGVPPVINNWTNGTVTAEMDLLPGIPITHRFRVRPVTTGR